jgi:hypothetical protein
MPKATEAPCKPQGDGLERLASEKVWPIAESYFDGTARPVPRELAVTADASPVQ